MGEDISHLSSIPMLRSLNSIFVTGTDTGVGKTVIAGLLLRYLKERGYSVITQKWVETGIENRINTDIKKHLFLGRIKEKEVVPFLPAMVSYSFRLPASPHLAAKCEQKKISVAKIKNDFSWLKRNFKIIIVEGAGGLCVPLNNQKTFVDLIRDFNLAVLVVVKNQLGAINHTLLTIEVLRKHSLNLVGIVFNDISKGCPKVILNDNIEIIRRLSKVKILGRLPYLSSSEELYKKFKTIGKRIEEVSFG